MSTMHPDDTSRSTRRAVRKVWDDFSARGMASGAYTEAVRAPWAVRVLMGGAGWLGALFFQLFLVGSVFLAARDNGWAMALCGAAMVALAYVLYRRRLGGIALEQFALAISLSGQGMVILGAAKGVAFERALESAGFWAGIAAFQALLFAVVPNRLHRLLCALTAWGALAVTAQRLIGPSALDGWLAYPWPLVGLVPLACVLLIAFTNNEAQLCTADRLDWAEPAADATLLFALGGALMLTGADRPWLLATGGAAPIGMHWHAGTVLAFLLAVFAAAEARRLELPNAAGLPAVIVALALGGLMAGAPAVSVGVLALGLALRRASLPWLGLGVATLLAGFTWYYSALSWTLLAKSATLAGAGVLVLLARVVLLRRGGTKELR